tara:strand:- start:169 stop:366 length:198 start_codon:yes stop_codon:yes gene_type:complete
MDRLDIVEAWNEAEELSCSLRELNDNEIIECKQSLLERANIIMSCLNKYVSEKDLKEERCLEKKR